MKNREKWCVCVRERARARRRVVEGVREEYTTRSLVVVARYMHMHVCMYVCIDVCTYVPRVFPTVAWSRNSDAFPGCQDYLHHRHNRAAPQFYCKSPKIREGCSNIDHAARSRGALLQTLLHFQLVWSVKTCSKYLLMLQSSGR